MTTKDIANLIPTMQSLALVSENVKESKKKKPDLVKLGMKNLVGVALIGETAKITNTL